VFLAGVGAIRVEATSLQDLNNLFAVRTLLERFAVVTLAERRLTDVDELRALADVIADTARANDVLAYVDADRALNPLLTRVIMELRDGIRLYGIDSAAGRQRQIASVSEHYEFIELATAGKVEEIAALMDRHHQRMEAIVHGCAVRSAGKRAGALKSIGPRGTHPAVVQPPRGPGRRSKPDDTPHLTAMA